MKPIHVTDEKARENPCAKVTESGGEFDLAISYSPTSCKLPLQIKSYKRCTQTRRFGFPEQQERRQSIHMFEQTGHVIISLVESPSNSCGHVTSAFHAVKGFLYFCHSYPHRQTSLQFFERSLSSKVLVAWGGLADLLHTSNQNFSFL